MKTTIVKRPKDINTFRSKFNAKLEYSTIPLEYFKSGRCYALWDGQVMVGGFCIVYRHFSLLRSMKQIPQSALLQYQQKYPHIFSDVADITGFFIDKPKYSAQLLWYIMYSLLIHPARYFVYSYGTHEHWLERYYGAGKPIRIHTGIPEKLPGHHKTMPEEHVEILTKFGIVRIVTNRFLKIARIKLKSIVQSLVRKKTTHR